MKRHELNYHINELCRIAGIEATKASDTVIYIGKDSMTIVVDDGWHKQEHLFLFG